MNIKYVKLAALIVAAVIGIGLMITFWPVVVGMLAVIGLVVLVYVICRN